MNWSICLIQWTAGKKNDSIDLWRTRLFDLCQLRHFWSNFQVTNTAFHIGVYLSSLLYLLTASSKLLLSVSLALSRIIAWTFWTLPSISLSLSEDNHFEDLFQLRDFQLFKNALRFGFLFFLLCGQHKEKESIVTSFVYLGATTNQGAPIIHYIV